jgi:hypothetical protein
MLDAEIAGQSGDSKGAKQMAHARQAQRTFPQVAIYPIIAAVAAILVAAFVAFSTLSPVGLPQPAVEAPNVDPALREAEARWELHRKLQSGDLDPLTKAEREWERLRRQLGPALE